MPAAALGPHDRRKNTSQSCTLLQTTRESSSGPPSPSPAAPQALLSTGHVGDEGTEGEWRGDSRDPQMSPSVC